MNCAVSILLVEDNPGDCQLIGDILAADGIDASIKCVDNRPAFEAALAEGGFQIILSDYTLPSFDGLAALGLARERCPDVPFILVSGVLGEETAVESLRAGASNYVLKQRLTRLAPVVRRALEEAGEHRKRRQAEEALRYSQQRFQNLVETASEWVWEVDPQIRFTYSSPRVFDLLGYRPEEVIGHSPLEFMPEAEARRIETLTNQLIAKPRQLGLLEITHLHRDGRTVILEASGIPILSPEGRLLGFRGIDRDITIQKQAQQALFRSESQLRALSARLENLREEERTRISREIHDELGQMLTGVKMDLRWIEHRLDDFGEDCRVNPILDKVVSAAGLIDATAKTVQRIAAELRPGILDNLGLPTALQYEASQFENRTGIPCKLVLPPLDPTLRPEAVTAFFRIFQEALTNVARHAMATQVETEFHAEGGTCRLEIRDNGKGLEGADLADPKSLGLLGMRERARMLGGSVFFTPRPGGGTVVTVHIPNITPQRQIV